MTHAKSKFPEKEQSACRYHHFIQVYQKLSPYAILFLRYGAWRMQFLFFILCYFLPFNPPNTAKNENVKKNEKIAWGYHHFTQVYQKSWPYATLFLRYGAWHIQLLFFILGYFLPFYFRHSLKNENFKKTEKNTWRYHHFTQVYQKSWPYATLFLRYGAWRMRLLFFILRYFFPFYPSNSTKMENFNNKKRKKSLEISSFYQKSWSYSILFLRYGAWHT